MKRIFLLFIFACIFIFGNAQNIGIGTTQPLARLHVADSNVVFTGPAEVPANTSYNPPIQGAGTRMMWYAQRAAFRVGGVDLAQWDKNNLGSYSFASGLGTVASGYGSTVTGGYGVASGLYATAMGISTNASGFVATSMGNSTVASGDQSFAIGNFTSAKSFAETSIGMLNTNYTPLSSTAWNATDRLFVIGNGTDINSRSNAMTVLKNGNTGLGISNPSEKLEVAGKIKTSSLQMTSGAANGNILMSDINGNASWQIPPSPVAYWTSSGSNIYNNNAGNVGIGTSAPNAPLQFATSNQKRKIVLFEIANNDNQFYGFGVFGGELRYQTGVTADDHVFYSSASALTSNELMRIKGNGNVGIGTSAPNAPLQFSNNTTNRKIVFYEAANNDHQFNGFGLNPGALRYQVNNTADDHVFYAGVSASASNELLRIKGNGNVGIGTPAPSAKLQIAGALTLNGAQATHTQGTYLEWNKDNNSGKTYLLNQRGLGSGGIVFGEVDNANNVTEKLRLDNNGAIAVMGNPGIQGQVLTSGGSSTAADWKSLGSIIKSYQTYPSLPVASRIVFVKVDNSSIDVTLLQPSRLLISYTLQVVTSSCVICSDINILLWVQEDYNGMYNVISTTDNVIHGGKNNGISLSNFVYDAPAGTHTFSLSSYTSAGSSLNYGINAVSNAKYSSHFSIIVLPL